MAAVGRQRPGDRRESATWPSATFFDMDWRGAYGADVLIEGWNARRLIGCRTHRITAFDSHDQFGLGPVGPMAFCAKATWDRPLPG